MTPYYDEDGITIYHGDCRDVAATVGNVGSIITDPPFFMPARHYQSRAQVEWQRSWGDASILGQWWADTIAVLVPNMDPSGSFLVFCDGASYPVFYPPMYRNFGQVDLVVWDKGRIGMGRPWRRQHELIAHARWLTSWWADDERGVADILKAKPTASIGRGHPVDKPAELLSRLVYLAAPPTLPVLDPFCGGGSTLLGARLQGRRAIGIETEERYCEIAAKRLSGMLALESA